MRYEICRYQDHNFVYFRAEIENIEETYRDAIH